MEHSTEGCECKGKCCNDCSTTKCLDYFSLRKGKGKSYPMPYCKPCYTQRKYTWAKANPNKVREVRKTYEEDNEHIKQIKRKNAKEWNKAHPQQVYFHRRKWIKTHPEHAVTLANQRRATELQAEGSYTAKEWSELKAKYNYTCLCCGKREPEIRLTVDHIVPLTKKGTNYIDNIQPLCQSCNSTKHTKIIDYRKTYDHRSV